jgi:lysophospholipase L1-like esterase
VRKYIVFLSLILLFLASCGESTMTLVPAPGPGLDGKFGADNPNISYYGRWDMSNPAAPATDWGAVYIRLAFEGPDLSLELEDEGNYFQYSIDNGPFRVIDAGEGQLLVLADGLSDANHELLLARRSHCKFGKTVIKGLRLKAGKNLLPPPPPLSRRIEFLGDSVSIGFANESIEIARFGDLETENGYMAFGPQAARILNADYHVIAKQALGVDKNLLETAGGSEPHIIDYYKRLLSDRGEWNFSSWVPDVVVIAAGAVDYLGLLQPYPSQSQYEPAYRELISFIRLKNPDAHIFCLVYYWGECADYTRNAVNAMIAGDSKIHLVDALSPEMWVTDLSCFIKDNLHPNVAGHTILAERLAAEIAAVMGW